MIQRVIFRPAAVEDVIEAAAWYEAHAPGLGEELIDEILRATARAQDNPELFRVVRPDGEIRRVLAERFPYKIFFSVARETLYVHAVPSWSTSRSPMERTTMNARLHLNCSRNSRTPKSSSTSGSKPRANSVARFLNHAENSPTRDSHFPRFRDKDFIDDERNNNHCTANNNRQSGYGPTKRKAYQKSHHGRPPNLVSRLR
jgi:plasmid stabilization system protein ParE